MKSLDDRLDIILGKITSDDFLRGKSVAGEIPFWIFDYLPEHEEKVRAHIPFLLEQAPKRRRGLKVAHVNLLALVRDILSSRNLLDKAHAMYRAKGSDAVLRAMKAPLDAEAVAKALWNRLDPEAEVVLISGVGSAYPLVRTHNLLNNLHPLSGGTPLLFFYPGRYDGQSLSLFGDLHDNPYYRAFRIDE